MSDNDKIESVGPFKIGDEIRYSKYKNRKGRIVRFGRNHKGQITVEIEPIPKGRKQNKELGLFKIWTVPAEATAAIRQKASIIATLLEQDRPDLANAIAQQHRHRHRFGFPECDELPDALRMKPWSDDFQLDGTPTRWTGFPPYNKPMPADQALPDDAPPRGISREAAHRIIERAKTLQAEVPPWIQQHACGECFEWAVNYMIDLRMLRSDLNGVELVHAACWHPEFKFYFAHGWIEEDGKAKDWQTIKALNEPPLSIKDFYKKWKPKKIKKYSFTEARKKIMETKVYGPWHNI